MIIQHSQSAEILLTRGKRFRRTRPTLEHEFRELVLNVLIDLIEAMEPKS